MFRYVGYRLGKIRATDANRGVQMTPDDADKWYMDRIRTLEAQNKRLRKWCTSLRESQQREFARSCEAATNNALKVDKLSDDNAKLRELVRDMWHDGMCDCDEFRVCAQGEYHCAQCEYHYPDCMRELGIEIEADDD